MLVMRVGFALAVSLVSLAGCGNSQPYVSELRLQRGLVIVLPGIEGRSLFNKAICRGLDEGGVDWAIELYDWTSHVPLAFLINLRSEHRNRGRAAEIAERIVRYQRNYPDRPIVLVGQSGGGAIAAWTCEAMPSGRKVDGVIILAATLSPEYPLATSLGNCRRGIVNFYSFGDVVLLWAGTIISGTMDGEHTSSAGRVGFTVPHPEARPAEYNRLFQVPWHKEMARRGNLGGHLTSGAAEFVAAYVSPLVLAPRWDTGVIAEVLEDANKLGSSQPGAETSGSSARRVTVEERAAQLAAGEAPAPPPVTNEEPAAQPVRDAQRFTPPPDVRKPAEQPAPVPSPPPPATQPAGPSEPTTRPAGKAVGLLVIRS
ncbi:MAG: hypothetical protein QF577_07550 [Phycisphaerae bacterium]|jgi:pimeloyl-ACP methyl ester carboxylesterase|nr:hypothetical protein [Phycisphaerae bacterium]